MAAMIKFALEDLECIEDYESRNDGVGRSYRWNDIACHGYNRRRKFV